MKKISLILIFIVSNCFAQNTISIIGFSKNEYTPVYSKPNYNNEYLKFRVNKTDSLEISDFVYDFPTHSNLFWKITFNGQTGYIRDFHTSQSNEIISFKLDLDKKDNLTQKRADSIRFAGLKNTWGAVIAKRIVNKEYWIGMSDEMCRKSLGFPDHINTSEGSWGTHEQWIYRKPTEKYLYFENGKLTSYQF